MSGSRVRMLDSTDGEKPDPEMYKAGLRLLNHPAGEVAMVAAHAYDLRAAKKV